MQARLPTFGSFETRARLASVPTVEFERLFWFEVCVKKNFSRDTPPFPPNWVSHQRVFILIQQWSGLPKCNDGHFVNCFLNQGLALLKSDGGFRKILSCFQFKK